LKNFWDGMWSTPVSFLKHEWTKHGVCWRPDFGNVSEMREEIQASVNKARTDYVNGGKLIIDYFHTVYQVQKALDFFKALTDANITPNNDHTYKLADIKKAFQTYFKVKKFDLICKKKDGQSLLTEVRIC